MLFAIYPMRGFPKTGLSFRVGWRTCASLLAVAIAVLAFTAEPALAAEPVFTVSGIAVDETADTAAAARARAFAVGQRVALNTLLRRLTLRRDHARLPEVDRERLQFMVQALEVEDEKTSTVRYLADMTVDFKADEIRQLLRDAAIPFAESVSKPVLVLPVLRQGNRLVLWDDPNLWREAWGRRGDSGTLVPIVVPVGDLSDIADVDAAQAAEGDPLRLSAIAGRYGAGDVLVAIATLSQTGETTRIDIAASQIGTPSQSPILLDFQTADPAAIPALFDDAAAAVATAVEDGWKAANIIQYDRPGTLLVAVPLSSLEEWVSVERRLNDIAAISQVSLISLTRDSAALEISHFGDEAQLATILAQKDLALEPAAPAPVGAASFGTPASAAAARMRVLRPVSP